MLEIGDKVKVVMPIKELTLSQTMRMFHGRVTRITGEVVYTQFSSRKTYLLEGCESDFGIPYEFHDEWLVPLDVEGE